MLLSSILSALVMWGVIALINRKQGLAGLKPVLIISFATAVAGFYLLKVFGLWGLLILMIALLMALRHWCYLTFGRAFLVMLSWLGTQIVTGWYLGPIY